MKKQTSDYYLVKAGQDEHIVYTSSTDSALAIVARNFLSVEAAGPADLTRILGSGASILREPEKAKRGPKPRVNTEIPQ